MVCTATRFYIVQRHWKTSNVRTEINTATPFIYFSIVITIPNTSTVTRRVTNKGLPREKKRQGKIKIKVKFN